MAFLRIHNESLVKLPKIPVKFLRNRPAFCLCLLLLPLLDIKSLPGRSAGALVYHNNHVNMSRSRRPTAGKHISQLQPDSASPQRATPWAAFGPRPPEWLVLTLEIHICPDWANLAPPACRERLICLLLNVPDISNKEPALDCEAWTPNPHAFQLSSATNSNRLLQKTLQFPVPSCTTLLSVMFGVSLSFYSCKAWCT